MSISYYDYFYFHIYESEMEFQKEMLFLFHCKGEVFKKSKNLKNEWVQKEIIISSKDEGVFLENCL